MSNLEISRYNLKLSQLNSALKLFVRGNKIHLRGTLPLSPEDALKSPHTPRKQYRLSTHCTLTSENCRYLYHLCREVTTKLTHNTFSWPWLRQSLADLNVEEEFTLDSWGASLLFSGAGAVSKVNDASDCHDKTSSCLNNGISSTNKPIQHPEITINPQILRQRHLFPHHNAYLPIHQSQITQCLEHLYYQRVQIKGISEHTWNLEYLKPVEFLIKASDEVSVPITPATLEHIVTQIPRNTRKRKRYQCVYRILLDSLGITYPFDHLKGTYTRVHVQPQTLPSDGQIEECHAYLTKKNSQWAKLYAVTATYGLRNVEHLYIDFNAYPNLYITQSKTGRPRYVLPFHEKWVDQFKISPDYTIPEHNRNSKLGFSHAVTSIFRDYHLPFRPKALRHCYARRMAELNYPAIYAAQLMGHSLQVHESTYLNFIGLESYQAARAFKEN